MLFSTTLVAALAAVASAAPSFPRLDAKHNTFPGDGMGELRSYFNLLAGKVKDIKNLGEAPVCDLSRAHMPDAPDNLPPPSKGLTVRHVAVGRGTQNYTCNANKPSEAPKATGAVATLFNASCVAATYPDVLNAVSRMSVHFNFASDGPHRLGPNTLPISGVHYFNSEGVPFFDLRTKEWDIGEAPCAKNASSPAPALAAAGQKGEAAVPWLKLTTVEGATGSIKEVYRVTTSGGSAPATCEGMPEAFEVEYSAVYWFWQGNAKDASN